MSNKAVLYKFIQYIFITFLTVSILINKNPISLINTPTPIAATIDDRGNTKLETHIKRQTRTWQQFTSSGQLIRLSIIGTRN